MKKVNGKLMFHDNGGYEFRNPSTIWCAREADKNYKWPDFNEIVINTGDYELESNYSYSRYGSFKKLIPDFNFHSWPQVGINDYSETIKEIDKLGRLLAVNHKVGWIGNHYTHPSRRTFVSIGNHNKDIMDIIPMSWMKGDDKVKLNATAYMSLPDLVKNYSVLIDIEGNGYSGRLKYLLWSHRPVILIERPFQEFFYEFLIPNVHYIPVKRDMSDLVEKVKWCLDNYEEALKIAENAYEFAKKHLTREACYAQWDKIVREHIGTDM
jgi:hypothetical protein